MFGLAGVAPLVWFWPARFATTGPAAAAVRVAAVTLHDVAGAAAIIHESVEVHAAENQNADDRFNVTKVAAPMSFLWREKAGRPAGAPGFQFQAAWGADSAPHADAPVTEMAGKATRWEPLLCSYR